ncbi:MAG: ankyrin repeat domain-containing protein [Synergistaceae bacterium]|nr:ankyrin repeat domain-containing protein [Synergistaceae bacterium]
MCSLNVQEVTELQDFDKDDLESVLRYLTGKFGIEILAGQGKTAGKEDIMSLLPDFFSPSSHKGDYSMLNMMSREGIMKALVKLKQAGTSGDELRRRIFAEKSKLTDNYIPEDVAVKFVNMIAGVLGLEVSSAPVVVEAMSDDEFLELCSSGDARAVEEALKNGADANACDEFGSTALHESANSGNPDVAEVLLKYGAEVDAKDFIGATALGFAVSKGYAEVAEVLLKHGADASSQDEYGKTPLHVAAFYGYAEIAEMLLRYGADVNAETSDGDTPLRMAKAGGHRETAKVLLKHGAEGSRAQRRQSASPARPARPAMSDEEFLELCQSGDAEAVEEALRHGANVNARDDEGETALMRAALNGHADAAEVLLSHGAKADARDDQGKTAFDIAQAKGHKSVAALLPRTAMSDADFLKLCRSDDVKAVEEALRNGANINARSEQGNTPLHFARNAETAEVLLINGADVHARNNDGETPLHVIVYETRYLPLTKTVELLLKYGADVNAKDNFGRTPLFRPSNVDTMELLLRHGADINARDNAGRTPLHLAAGAGDVERADILMRRGANKYAKDNEGKYPRDYTRYEDDEGYWAHNDVYRIVM